MKAMQSSQIPFLEFGMNISSFKTAIGYWKIILLPGGIVGVGVASVVFVWGFLLALGLNTVLEVTVILDGFVSEVIITGFFWPSINIQYI